MSIRKEPDAAGGDLFNNHPGIQFVFQELLRKEGESSFLL